MQNLSYTCDKNRSKFSIGLKTDIVIRGTFCGQMGAQQYVRRAEGEDFNPENAAAVQAAAGRMFSAGGTGALMRFKCYPSVLVNVHISSMEKEICFK